MWTRIIGHVRSQLVGYVALFIALGGTAIAALPANSVGTKQLQNGAVTGQKVAGHTLTGANINLSTLGTVPNAARLGGRLPSAFQSRVSGSCSASHAISAIAATGAVSCQPTGTGATQITFGIAAGSSHSVTIDEMTISASCVAIFGGNYQINLQLTSSASADVNGIGFRDANTVQTPVPIEAYSTTGPVSLGSSTTGNGMPGEIEAQVLFNDANRTIAVQLHGDAGSPESPAACRVYGTAAPSPS